MENNKNSVEIDIVEFDSFEDFLFNLNLYREDLKNYKEIIIKNQHGNPISYNSIGKALTSHH